MLTFSKKLSEHKDKLVEALLMYSKVLYGVNPENMPIELFRMTAKYILDNFQNMTFNDITLAYEGVEIEKKEYVSLTRDELLKPIKNYWRKKELVEHEFNQIQNLKSEEDIQNQKVLEFKKQSWKLYIDSLEKNDFLLDEFNCKAIHKHFKIVFSDSEIEEFELRAKREYKERKFKADEDGSPFVLVPPEDSISAKIIVEEAFKRKVTITKKK